MTTLAYCSRGSSRASDDGRAAVRATWRRDDDDDADEEEAEDDAADDGDEGEAVASDDDDHWADDRVDESVVAHRRLIGDVLQKLADRGFDVEDLAEQAGVGGHDPETLSADDLGVLTQFLAGHFPDVFEALQHRYPDADSQLDDLPTDGRDRPFGGIGKLFD